MVKKVIIFLIFLIFLSKISYTQVKIIFDTDIHSDVDDMGALAMLHALADNGEAEILGVTINSKGYYSAGAVDAVNTYYNRPNLRIGVKDYSGSWDYGSYVKFVSDSFICNVKNADHEDVEDAVTMLQDILGNNNDVVIVTVGFLNNLYDLMQEPGGITLISNKVSQWAACSEWNFEHSGYLISQYVVDNWPANVKIVLTGGSGPVAGAGLINTPENNPVRGAYARFYCCGGPKWMPGYPNNYWPCDHHVADLHTMLYAVRGLSPYYTSDTTGYYFINDQGYQTWYDSLDKNHEKLIWSWSEAAIGDVIEVLMCQPPSGGGDTTSPSKKQGYK